MPWPDLLKKTVHFGEGGCPSSRVVNGCAGQLHQPEELIREGACTQTHIIHMLMHPHENISPSNETIFSEEDRHHLIAENWLWTLTDFSIKKKGKGSIFLPKPVRQGHPTNSQVSPCLEEETLLVSPTQSGKTTGFSSPFCILNLK